MEMVKRPHIAKVGTVTNIEPVEILHGRILNIGWDVLVIWEWEFSNENLIVKRIKNFVCQV
jgi:G:T-mismatch repair DNA endonuclease (very short patch repair protein)